MKNQPQPKKSSKMEDKFKNFKRAYQEHAAAKYAIIMAFFVTTIVVLIGTGLTSTHVSDVNDTGINDYQQLGEGYKVGMISRSYNPKINTMQINLDLQNQDDQGIVYPRLKFDVKLLNQQQGVHTQIIRAGNSSYVVILKNLRPKFGAVLIKVSTKLDTNQGNVTDISETDLTNQDETITNSDTDSSQDNGTVDIYINETNRIINDKLKKKSRVDYQVETVQNEIRFLKKQIESLQKDRADNQKEIAADQQAIEKNISERKYQVQQEKDQSKQQDDQTHQDIQSRKSEISDIEKAIKVRKQKINLLNQKIQDIKSGSYKVE